MEYSGFQRSRSLPRAWFRWKWCPRGETGNRNPRLRIIPYTLPLAPSGSATTRSRQLPTILRPPPPPPPLFPPFVAFLHFQTLSPAAILYRRQEPIYLQRSPSFTLSLSLSFSLPVLETKFKLDTANNGAPMGKYDSVIYRTYLKFKNNSSTDLNCLKNFRLNSNPIFAKGEILLGLD